MIWIYLINKWKIWLNYLFKWLSVQRHDFISKILEVSTGNDISARMIFYNSFLWIRTILGPCNYITSLDRESIYSHFLWFYISAILNRINLKFDIHAVSLDVPQIFFNSLNIFCVYLIISKILCKFHFKEIHRWLR